jgi:hypothetical protein
MAANKRIDEVCSYNEMLLSIQKQYLQMVPLRNFDWKVLIICNLNPDSKITVKL